MLCCSNGILASKYAPVDTTDDVEARKNEGQRQNNTTSATHGTTASFPGMRRANTNNNNTDINAAAPKYLAATGGNALREYNPAIDDASNKQQMMIAVTVPPNATPGQVIHVETTTNTTPGQQSERVEVRIPDGLKAGDTFHVNYTLPPNASKTTMATTGCEAAAAVMMPPQRQMQPSQRVVTGEEMTTTTPLQMQAPAVVAVPLQPPPAISHLPPVPAPPVAAGDNLVQVNVPPNTPPGTTIHVQIPGQNRLVAAVVPPGNVRQFHVAYDDMSAPAQSELQAHSQSMVPAGQVLVLVQIPPGTPAGTTMHVQVPGEQNRVIEAVVPPGNVSQFHVAYTP